MSINVPVKRIFSGFSAAACALFCAVLLTAQSAQAAFADDLKDATRLYQESKLDQALVKVNAALAAQPKDPQSRFLKGIIFTEQKKTAEAIQIFTGLTEDYPELPEPYNNLAVLYAAQGNFDKAKSALELAINTHPTYATAHENLGDIYAQLARRAYDKALQLDKNNTTAQTKLALVKNLFTVPPPTATAPAPTTVPAPATAKVEAPKPVAATTATVTAANAKAEPAATGDAAQVQVKAMIEAWAAAWASKDVPGYLSHYAPNFETPDGIARDAWNQQRKERIEKPMKISVNITMTSITVKGDEATAIFKQKYRSDTAKSDGTKTIKAVKVGGKWMILSERTS